MIKCVKQHQRCQWLDKADQNFSTFTGLIGYFRTYASIPGPRMSEVMWQTCDNLTFDGLISTPVLF